MERRCPLPVPVDLYPGGVKTQHPQIVLLTVVSRDLTAGPGRVYLGYLEADRKFPENYQHSLLLILCT